MLDIAQHLDLTLLSPTASYDDIVALVETAKENDVYAVCVSPNMVSIAAYQAKGSNVKVASVVGFPSGAHSTNTKLYEAEEALNSGASEIDMVANLSYIATEDWFQYQEEINVLQTLVSRYDAVLKVIIESAMWDNERIATATKKAADMGVAYVKTSTGYSAAGGATIEAVEIMLSNCGESKIKASGGIRTLENAKSYLQLGVDRIGASSVSVLGRESSTANSSY